MAKRMVLVDEKLLDYQPILQHFQTKQETRPTEQTVKSLINEDIRSTLSNPSIPEDVKAKQYSVQLNRYLNTKRKLPDVPTVNELLDEIKPEGTDEIKKGTRKRKRPPTVNELLDEIKPEGTDEIKKGTRKRKRPKRFEWEEW